MGTNIISIYLMAKCSYTNRNETLRQTEISLKEDDVFNDVTFWTWTWRLLQRLRHKHVTESFI